MRKPTTEQITRIRRILRDNPVTVTKSLDEADRATERLLEPTCVKVVVGDRPTVDARLFSWKAGTREYSDQLIEVSSYIRASPNGARVGVSRHVIFLVHNVDVFIRDLKKFLVISGVHDS